MSSESSQLVILCTIYVIVPQFQSQSHVDRQEWLTILTLDIPFIPLDFNPVKAPVIAQSSGKPLDPPQQLILLYS